MGLVACTFQEPASELLPQTHHPPGSLSLKLRGWGYLHYTSTFINILLSSCLPLSRCVMSGVEILGIVAASSQLLGQGPKALRALSGLCSRLRDAPHEVLKTVEEIENLIQLTKSIKTSLENTSFTLQGGNSSASSRLAFGVRLLEECAKESADLENLIKPLLPTKSDSLIRRSWGAVIKTKKTEQILQRCRHIEAKKSSLILWLDFVKLSQAYEQRCGDTGLSYLCCKRTNT